jgi:spore cortex formation protein SpoVR/YcgB (stage V sporulation)
VQPAYGHNHFFKNNYQFQMWTQPDHIIDYPSFAKTYVAEAREGHGTPPGSVLDAACPDEPGRQPGSVSRRATSLRARRSAAAQRRAYEEATFDPTAAAETR